MTTEPDPIEAFWEAMRNHFDHCQALQQSFFIETNSVPRYVVLGVEEPPPIPADEHASRW